MKQRFITAFALIAVLGPILFLGGIPFKILMAVFAIMGSYEIIKLAEANWPRPLQLVSYVFSLIIMFANLLGLNYFFLADCLILICLFTMLVFCKEVSFESIGMMFIFYNMIGMMAAGFMKMYSISNMMVFYMLFANCVTDAAAYFVGRAIGKHKLNERISPNKTIEGSVGGYIFGAVISFLFAYLTLIKPLNVSVLLIIIGSLTMPIVGQIGDLAYSAIKRHYGIKDFGTIFPGHGGVLDRIDSVCFNSMWLYVLMLVIL
ncbi:MAG: phosphatidate cytidylyltransferase [Erysipelotrichaceae bacterium]|nr:phosphatidate cytidylyltransferase [Erysipelotrichaceae bacterium]